MPDKQNGSEHFILFGLMGTTYGIRSNEIQQMDMVEHITPVPNAPDYVEGLVFIRGQVVPAINLRVRFGFEKVGYDMRTRLIVVQKNARKVGLIVDFAREFVSIPLEAIAPPPEAMSGLSGRYLEGIATVNERLILILNIDEVLQLAETIKSSPEGEYNEGGTKHDK